MRIAVAVLAALFSFFASAQPYPSKPIRFVVATGPGAPFALVVHPGLQAHSVSEFIALAKSRPGKLNYGTLGAAPTMPAAPARFSTTTDCFQICVSFAARPYRCSNDSIGDDGRRCC